MNSAMNKAAAFDPAVARAGSAGSMTLATGGCVVSFIAGVLAVRSAAGHGFARIPHGSSPGGGTILRDTCCMPYRQRLKDHAFTTLASAPRRRLQACCSNGIAELGGSEERDMGFGLSCHHHFCT
jgi:hypothetical protein